MLKQIFNAFNDEISQKIFEAKVESVVLNEPLVFSETIIDIFDDWESDDVNLLLTDNNFDKDIYIFGAGYHGQLTFNLLEKFGISNRIIGYIDSDIKKQGGFLHGKKIIDRFDIENPNSKLILLAANLANAGEIYSILLNMYELPRENIIFPRSGHIRAWRGQQYFDEFEPCQNEVFVDAGSSFGNTTVEFYQWCNGAKKNYAKIYGFDVRKNSDTWYASSCKQKGLHDARFINKGLWGHSGILKFSEEGSASRIVQDGTSVINVTTLDDELNNDYVSFIKMDIEGAELEALKGCKQTIKKHTPKLAISVYHKPEDMIAIPYYILTLIPKYKFTLRTYCSDGSETVLYARM